MITVDLDRLNIKSGYKILDVGCGSGRHMSAIYDMKDVMVVGSDVCFENLKSADGRMKIHDQLAEHGSGKWELSLADVTCLPFSDSCFDFVICSEVLEHVHNDKCAIEELVRVLKPGRILVISVPSYLPEKICWALSKEYAGTNQNHIRIYHKQELINLFESSDMVCYDSHYSHSLHTPFWLLKCLVGLTITDSILVNLYHKFLVWDIMNKPYFTRIIDKLLNPILGKSVVLYFAKNI